MLVSRIVFTLPKTLAAAGQGGAGAESGGKAIRRKMLFRMINYPTRFSRGQRDRCRLRHNEKGPQVALRSEPIKQPELIVAPIVQTTAVRRERIPLTHERPTVAALALSKIAARFRWTRVVTGDTEDDEQQRPETAMSKR